MGSIKSDFSKKLAEAKHIRAELGGSERLEDPFPNKPKRMKWAQYWDLYLQGADIERALASIIGKPKLHSSRKHTWKKGRPPSGLFTSLNTAKVKSALSNSSVPDHVQRIQKSLDNLSKTNGILLIDDVVDTATIFSIAAHVNAKHISEIRHKNWEPLDLDLVKQAFKEGSDEFKALFHIDIPDFIFELNHYQRAMSRLTQNLRYGFSRLDMNGLESLSGGIFKSVFEGKKPKVEDAFKEKFQHHHLNYFPLFYAEYDSVTQGLIFDYQEGSFSPFIAYVSYGYAGREGIWDRLKKATSCDGTEFYWTKKEFEFRELNDLIDSDQAYDLSDWFCDLATTGYLNLYDKPSTQLDGVYKPRFDVSYSFQNENWRTLESHGFFLASNLDIYPFMPVRLEGNFHPIFSLERLKSLLGNLESSLVRRGDIKFHPMGIKKFVNSEKKLKENLLELMGIDSPEWKSIRKLADVDVDSFFEALEGFCNKETEAGRPYLAFIVGLYAWSCMEPVTTKLSANLLQNVPDDLCHPFIKTVARCIQRNDSNIISVSPALWL